MQTHRPAVPITQHKHRRHFTTNKVIYGILAFVFTYFVNNVRDKKQEIYEKI